jgi:hypothetical protein
MLMKWFHCNTKVRSARLVLVLAFMCIAIVGVKASPAQAEQSDPAAVVRILRPDLDRFWTQMLKILGKRTAHLPKCAGTTPQPNQVQRTVRVV